MELKYIGGVFGGNIKPTPFLCLVLKMLQIQPEKDIVVEFIKNEDFKYVRTLGAVYMRLVGTSLDCFKYLEPLYNDYRKLRRQNKAGAYEIVHMDEFIDELLREERVCDIILPRIQKRNVLEDTNQLEQRISALDEDIEDMESSEEEEVIEPHRSPTPERKRGSHKDNDKSYRSPSPRSRRNRSRSPHRRDRKSPVRRRSRSRSRERRHRSPVQRHREDDRKKRNKKTKRDHKERSRDDDRHRDRGRDRDRDRDDKRDRDTDHHRDRGHRSGGRESTKEMEIREANEVRARLGLAPLRP